jgi:hypothetical protein
MVHTHTHKQVSETKLSEKKQGKTTSNPKTTILTASDTDKLPLRRRKTEKVFPFSSVGPFYARDEWRRKVSIKS